MKILKTYQRKSAPPPELTLLRGDSDFLELPLDNIYPELAVRYIFMHKKCSQQINDWVVKSLDSQPVPEVGGFLLGRYSLGEKEEYMVVLEEFVTAKEVAKATPIRLDFGISPFLDLDKALEDNQGLELLGWLHTHPGHHPYLSDTDLHAHVGFFPKKYQIAVVLDPLTESYEFGIFCRTVDNRICNKEDFSHWIDWKRLTL